MSITLDPTTQAEYLAQPLAASRATLIRDALTAPVLVRVYRSQQAGPQLMGSGTMADPWCSVSGATITIGEVNSSGFAVSEAGIPDGSWYLQFEGANGRTVRGGFGLTGSGADFVWSLSSFAAGGKATIGAATLTATGAAGALPLLSPSDITYLGFYEVDNYPLPGSDGDSFYGWGLALRRVNNQPRLLMMPFKGNTGATTYVVEVNLAGRALGSALSGLSNYWAVPDYGGATTFQNDKINSTGGDNRHHIHWDDASGKLLYTFVVSYGAAADTYAASVDVLTLPPTGNVATVKKVFPQGVLDRWVNGGMMSIPASFQAQYGVGPISLGMGGYVSLISGSGGGRMGFTTYAIANPDSYAIGGTIPSSQIKLMSEHGAGQNERGDRIFYGYTFTPNGGSVVGDAGTLPTGTFSGNGPIDYNYGHFGGPQLNPPTYKPVNPEGVAWGEIPPGSGRSKWVYGDSYGNGAFIYGPNKRGVIAVGGFGIRRTFYYVSAWYWEGSTAEVHIFDPDHLGEVALGTRSAQSIQPVSMKPLPETSHPGSWTSAAFSAYDPVDKRLYVRFGGPGSVTSQRIYVYSVNA